MCFPLIHIQVKCTEMKAHSFYLSVSHGRVGYIYIYMYINSNVRGTCQLLDFDIKKINSTRSVFHTFLVHYSGQNSKQNVKQFKGRVKSLTDTKKNSGGSDSQSGEERQQILRGNHGTEQYVLAHIRVSLLELSVLGNRSIKC